MRLLVIGIGVGILIGLEIAVVAGCLWWEHATGRRIAGTGKPMETKHTQRNSVRRRRGRNEE